jgi:CRISPR-associated protein Cst2
MTLHVFANAVTPFGTAANNRAETEGNITTLQKLIWQGQPHSTVSAEAIRFALREQLADMEDQGTNRRWDEAAGSNQWQDHEFQKWNNSDSETYIDDDLLGFMSAEAAKDENSKGTTNAHRAVLEVTRAVSITPWAGDVTFNAASPNATASAQKQGSNPVPYGTEVHATRYQFGAAMTPARLRQQDRAGKALQALASLRNVAGNHGRFLFDFSPDAIVLRITDDPAPRLLYCFETTDDGQTLKAPALLKRIEAGDVKPDELILGTSDTAGPLAEAFRGADVTVTGVKDAINQANQKIHSQLTSKS